MRLLVVEDNPTMADALRRGLIAEGFDVDVSGDGLDGLWRAREFGYDLLILDILLPGMNGYLVCRTLREEANSVPILLLTAKSGDEDEAEGLDLGADDYLTKPFHFHVLVARINALLRRSNPTPTSSRIVTGEVIVDTATKTCVVGDTPIELSAREYAVLEALARRLGQPLTRSELGDLVWGADYPINSNVVDVYISYLRNKLRAAGSQADLVETIRGVGYRMVKR